MSEAGKSMKHCDLVTKIWEASDLFRDCLSEAGGFNTEGEDEEYRDYLNEPITLLDEEEIGVCVVGASSDQSVYLLAGNPILIALYLKRYREAVKMTRKRTYLLEDPEYQAWSLFRCLPDGSYETEKMPGNWDLLFMDEDMPDDVFAFFCRRFLGGDRKAETNEVPAIPLMMPMTLSDRLINVQLSWESLKKTLDGLCRMKRTAPEVWSEYHDEAFERNLVCEVAVLMKKPIFEENNGKSIDLLRNALDELGCIKVVDPKDLIICGGLHFPIKGMMWFAKFWKRLYQKERLIISVSDFDSEQLYRPLLAILGQDGTFFYSNDTGSMGYEEFDGLEWDENEEYLEIKAVLDEYFGECFPRETDPAILLEALCKKIIPRFYYPKLLGLFHKKAPDLIPLLILGNYSEKEEK